MRSIASSGIPGPLVVDGDDQGDRPSSIRADIRFPAIANGVFQKIAQGPFYADRPARIGAAIGLLETSPRDRDRPDRRPRCPISAARSTLRVGSTSASSRTKARVASVIRCISSSVSRILRWISLVFDELGAQAKRGDGRAQIVRHGGKHLRSILNETVETIMHAIEGAGGLANVDRADLRQGIDRFPPPCPSPPPPPALPSAW